MSNNIIPFSLPDEYDPEVLAETIKAAVNAAISSRKDVDKPATSAAAPFKLPSRSNAQRCVLSTPAAGTLGDVTDPRFAQVAVTRAGGVEGPFQRFRFEGVILNPFLVGPGLLDPWAITADGASFSFFTALPAQTQIAFGQFVYGIPHSLGRIPEFVLGRSSSNDSGPVGQRVQMVRNDGAMVSPAVGTNIRCEFDFIPIFGATLEDVERAMKMIVGTWDGVSTTSEHWFDGGDALVGETTIDAPRALRGLMHGLVTTDKTFGGLIVATAWGLPTWQSAAVENLVAGFAVAQEVATGPMRDPVTTVNDQMMTCVLPEVGKSLYAMRTKPVFTVQDAVNAVTQIGLVNGSVDFILG